MGKILTITQINWKSAFSNRDNQIILSRLVRTYLVSTLDLCFKNGAFDRNELNRIAGTFKVAAEADYSDTIRLLNVRLHTIYSEKTISIFNVLRFMVDDLTADDNIHQKLWEFREFDGVARQISVYRNAWSHHTKMVAGGGWELLLGGLLFRLCDLVQNENNSASVNQMRKLALQLCEKIMIKNSSCDTPSITEENNEISHNQFLFSEIKEIREDIGSIFSMLKVADQIGEASNLDEVASRDEAVDQDVKSQDLLRQRLSKIKNQIEYENEFDINYPGPDANILKSSIIDQMLEFNVCTIARMSQLPEFLWAMKSYKKSMDSQLETWADKIQNILEQSTKREDGLK